MRSLIKSVAAVAVVLIGTGACATPNTNAGAVSDGSGSQAASPQPPAPETPTWGKRYTWPDKLAVEVAAPRPCKPSEYAQPPDIKRAVLLTVTVINGTDKPFDVGVLSVAAEAQFAGRKAESVIDFGGPCAGSGGMGSGTVLPGKTFAYDLAFAVNAEPGELQLAMQPQFDSAKAIFVGQA
ncbi:MAG: hypothetical protein ABW215_03790 [Kibdelosporangium sp.]